MLIYGRNPIVEYLKFRQCDIKKIWTCDKNIVSEFERLYKIKPALIDKNQIISQIKNPNVPHQNIIAEVEMTNIYSIEELIEKSQAVQNREKVIIILDHLSDPHNFGAIIRSAVFFKACGIIFAKDRQTPLNPTVIKASSGAAAHINFACVANIHNAIEKLKKNNFWIYAAAAAGGDSPKKIDPAFPIGLIVGNEGEGPKNLTLKSADFRITIAGNTEIDSLNVSVSAALLLYQIHLNYKELNF